MWQLLSSNQHKFTDGFYVGDAAGRPQDFSDSDKVFSSAIGLPFYTPDRCFPTTSVIIPNGLTDQTMFILVGMPGSGKSTFVKNNLLPNGYVWLSGDILKSTPRLQKEAVKNINQGKSIVIDATNPKLETRSFYISLAKTHNVKCAIIYFIRDGHGFNSLRTSPESPVPEIAYSLFYKNLVEPSPQEGVPIAELE